MSAKKQADEVVYNKHGRRVCGSRHTATGEPCMRPCDVGLTHCFRHPPDREPNGSAPKRGKQWTDHRGHDTSYVQKLGLHYHPEASDSYWEITMLTQMLGSLAKQYEIASRSDRAGRSGANPAAIRAEMMAIMQQKEKLVRTQLQAQKALETYLSFDQARVFFALMIYVVRRLGLSKTQLAQFDEDIRTVAPGPWRVAELKKREVSDADAAEYVRWLYAELWEERHGTQPPPALQRPVDDETTDVDDETEDTDEDGSGVVDEDTEDVRTNGDVME